MGETSHLLRHLLWLRKAVWLLQPVEAMPVMFVMPAMQAHSVCGQTVLSELWRA